MSDIGFNKQVPLGSRTSDAAEKAQSNAKLAGLASGNSLLLQEAAVAGALTVAAAGPVGAALLVGGAALAIGMPLKMPGKENEVYTVKEGDNLTNIAKKALGEKATPAEIDKFIDKIVNLNGDIIKNGDHIYAGDKIAIPELGKAGSAKAEISFIDD